MARSVRDAAILLQAIAGYDPGDPYSQDVAVDDYLADIESGVHGWRVAFASGSYFQESSGCMGCSTNCCRVFSALGASVEVEIPEFENAARASGYRPADAAEFHKEHLETRPGRSSRCARPAAAASDLRFYQARRTQAVFRAAWVAQYDLLLLPVTPVPALQIGREEAVQRAARSPALPVQPTSIGHFLPCGFVSRDGVSLQLVCRWLHIPGLKPGCCTAHLRTNRQQFSTFTTRA
jgi:Asp-tRNA(Asn)/Glu-tRNA(Gln) amidotransferase A subunit family amidase